MRGLKGKVAVVAGGAGGIGTATSIRLAEEGARGSSATWTSSPPVASPRRSPDGVGRRLQSPSTSASRTM